MQRTGWLMATGFLGLFLIGCRAAPSGAEVEAVVRGHFEARHYRVVELELGEVSPVPLKDKTYMGARGFQVRVRRITLEATEASGPAYEAGERLTFRNATVRLTEGSHGRGWVVSRVTGVTVP